MGSSGLPAFIHFLSYLDCLNLLVDLACGFAVREIEEKNPMMMQKCLSEMVSRSETFGNSFYQMGGA